MTRSRRTAAADGSAQRDRPLLRLERQILFRVTSIDWDGADDLRASIPHLGWTGGCECGCGSFTVRDLRHPEQDHALEQWCDAFGADGVGRIAVWLGNHGRLMVVAVEDPEGGQLPVSADLRVRWPAPARHDGRRRPVSHPYGSRCVP